MRRSPGALALPYLWLMTALLAWVAACYVPALPGPYQFDDRVGVAVDPGAASLSSWWQSRATHVRPLLKASFALSHGLGEWLGNVPAGHRVVNLATHLATIVVVWRLGLLLAATCLSRLATRDAAFAATIAAAVFGLHPLATEAVSYVSGRSMSLGTLLACSCLASWIHARCRGSLAWGAASVLLAGLAALCRETAVLSIPLLVLAWELVREGRPADMRRQLFAIARALLPFAALACATLLWMLFWHERYAALLRLSWWIAQVRADDASLLTVLGYLGKAALLLQAPSIDPAVSAAALPLAARVLGSLAVGAALWGAWHRRSVQPQWLFGAVWVLAWLLPLYALGLRHDAVSERHLYPVLWGMAWAAAITLAPAMRRAAADPAATASWLGRGLPLAAVLLILSTMTITRNQDYRSEVALWESAMKSAPHKLRVLNNLGVAYMEAGRWTEAAAVLTRALELHPGDDVLPWNLAAARRRDLRVLTEPVLIEWPALAGAAVADGP